jgi:bifunctional UDP-N-acetylglucosamine pyrophosphorylase / glucosamine-1-phosphate N-acetyltransferase
MSASAIILAAGKATRLKSKKPKVLHEVCGRPMLHYILEAAYGAGCDRVMVVVGYGKEEVMAQFADDRRIIWVEQTEQLGTGHAALMCNEHLQKQHGDVFVLVGDVPLIRGEVLRTLLRAHRDERAAASCATAELDDPYGYGRIIRDENGEFIDIVEEIDCTPEQREIREIFPSYYCCKAEELVYALSRLTNNNKKGEYYLTDIFAILRNAGKRVVAVKAVTYEDVLAPNTRAQLAEADCVMQERIFRQLRDSGVTIVSDEKTYIESGVSIGTDTVVQPFTFIGRDASIGGECVIGPFATVPRGAVVPEGTSIAGNICIENALLGETGG